MGAVFQEEKKRGKGGVLPKKQSKSRVFRQEKGHPLSPPQRKGNVGTSLIRTRGREKA